MYTKQLASIEGRIQEKEKADRKVQIVLVGHDNSEEAGKKYLLDQEIPFPAIKFDFREGSDGLIFLGEEGNGALPFVSIFQADGTLVAQGGEPRIVYRVSKLVDGSE